MDLLFTSLALLLLSTSSLATISFQISQSEDCGIIDEVPGDVRTSVPWVASIFARQSSKRPYNYFTTGAIINPTTVITVLGGTYGHRNSAGHKYYIPPAGNHIVAVGLKSASLDATDSHTQVMEVSYILPNSRIDSENRNYHFFLFRLKKPLNLTSPYARAACIPVFSKFLPSTPFTRSTEAVQGGYAITSDQQSSSTRPLTTVTTQLQSEEFCSKEFKENYGGDSARHVYCGLSLYKEGSKRDCVSYGGTMTLKMYEQRWFLLGITALHSPTPSASADWCSDSTVYFYAHFINIMEWILEHLKCGPTEFSCGDKCIPFSQVCDQTANCEDRRDEDPIFCRARKPCIFPGKPFECGVYGPCLPKDLVCNNKTDCPGGEDETPSACNGDEGVPELNQLSVQQASPAVSESASIAIAPRAGIRCPPLQRSEGVVIECTDEDGRKVSCDSAWPGITAKLKCQRHYVSTYRLPSTMMTCRDAGSWKPPRAFGCDPQCGILTTKLVQSYIVQGQAAVAEDPFPWHTAIFKRYKDEFSYICGGSLIEKNILITAAHCVTDISGVLQPASNFKVALGGNSSDFELNERNPHAQIFNVKKMFIPNTFDRHTLQSDIALIQLDGNAKYGESIRPVCSLIKGASHVPPAGTLGKVPGYGFTAAMEQTVSEKLLYATFPVIDRAQCLASLKKNPPLSTFCAGYTNGTSVCQGDSGGGMVFPETTGAVEKYVLKGIVSHGGAKKGLLCDPDNYAVFTHVDSFADWILPKLDEIKLKI